MLNLDTNVLVEILENRLPAKTKRLLQRDRDWSISAMLLWEIGKLRQRSRLNFGFDFPALVEALAQITIWPVDRRRLLERPIAGFSGRFWR